MTGRVTRLRAHLVWSPETRIPLRRAGRHRLAADRPAVTWGADERIRRAPPSYASDVRFAIVHHTAGKNGYSRSEAAAIVKGIQLFHVQGNGWNDIGYNFLVDRFGTIYEGRFGGVDRNVIGAHALGFNTGSVGIALLGTYEDATPSAAAQDAIARLDRVAARPRPRRPDRLPHVHLRRERSLRERDPGASERRLGPSRHGVHRVPGRRPRRHASADRGTARELGGLKIFEPRATVAANRLSASARGSRRRRAWAVAITELERRRDRAGRG